MHKKLNCLWGKEWDGTLLPNVIFHSHGLQSHIKCRIIEYRPEGMQHWLGILCLKSNDISSPGNHPVFGSGELVLAFHPYLAQCGRCRYSLHSRLDLGGRVVQSQQERCVVSVMEGWHWPRRSPEVQSGWTGPLCFRYILYSPWLGECGPGTAVCHHRNLGRKAMLRWEKWEAGEILVPYDLVWRSRI